MGGQNSPGAPNPAQTYKQGIQIYQKYLPSLLQGEQTARGLYDPQRIEEQQALQQVYGPAQYAQQLSALHQIDPYSTPVRAVLANRVAGQLAPGGAEDARTALENYFRGQTLANQPGRAALGSELQQELV